MNELKLRQLFKNLSDCYADTGRFENDGGYTEGEVIQAMTEDRFIEVLKEAKILPISDVVEQSKQLVCDCTQPTNKYYDDNGVKKCWECRREENSLPSWYKELSLLESQMKALQEDIPRNLVERRNDVTDLETFHMKLSAMRNRLHRAFEELTSNEHSLPFPNDYKDVKDSYLDFMETAMMIDVKTQPMNEIVDKTDKATDNFAKYLLRQ